MKSSTVLRLGLTAALAGLFAGGLPAGAAGTAQVTVGSPSVPGTIKNFQLVGHTDLGNRGMNSPIALAGKCAYLGDRSYAATPRKNAGIAIVDISNPADPRQVN